ncbi:uncharacterized protein LOC128555115 [Mercenaria mercenaria]|uniref:uncharacterized protein LOC128555115 n=1 Tax=Mercenaria mercenaria TaxID=6596 RepID=UPI00234E5142|nr:uncharacterized protein LOC128555115 [Mercenaria mercenaria]
MPSWISSYVKNGDHCLFQDLTFFSRVHHCCHAEFSERQNYRNCRLLLDEFKESVFQFNHEKSVRVLECIGDSDWLERTTYRIIQYMLTSTPSVHKVTRLLKILDSESITLVFKHVDPDFRRQSQMLQCIEEGEIWRVNFSALLTS